MSEPKNRDDMASRIELRRMYLKEVPAVERIEAKLPAFHAWLIRAGRSDLLPRDTDDAYLQLVKELKGLYEPY